MIKLFLYGEGVDFCHGLLENKQSVGNGDFSVAVNICRGNLAVGKADLSDRTLKCKQSVSELKPR